MAGALFAAGCGDSDGDDASEPLAGAAGTPSRGGSSGSMGKGGAAGMSSAGRGGSGGTQNAGTGGSAGRGGASGAGGAGGTSGSAATGGSGGDAGGAAGEPGAGTGGMAGGPQTGECGAVETFEALAAPAPVREIFVDASAAGSGDGSATNPYATLDEALADASAGTAIRIRPGTYDGGAFASGLNGSAEAPIRIGGVDPEMRPVISGGNNAIQLSGASYVILHDLEIEGQSANGLNVDDGEVASQGAHHLVFRNLYIHDVGDGGNQDCLKLSGVYDFFVLDSMFEGCSSGGSAIDHVGCHAGVIAGNTFRDCAGSGVQSKGGSSDIEITRNRFLGTGERAVNMGGSTGFEFFRPALSPSGINYEARDIRVTANVFRGGISPIAFVGCVSCLAANNTIVDPERWVVRILQETTSSSEYAFLPAQDGRFVNNIVYYAAGELSTHVNVGPDTSPETFEFSNNLWYAHDVPADSEPSSLPVTESDGIYGQDPGFAAAESDDFSIAEGSPAHAAGSPGLVLADVNGACYATPPSVGADEVD